MKRKWWGWIKNYILSPSSSWILTQNFPSTHSIPPAMSYQSWEEREERERREREREERKSRFKNPFLPPSCLLPSVCLCQNVFSPFSSSSFHYLNGSIERIFAHHLATFSSSSSSLLSFSFLLPSFITLLLYTLLFSFCHNFFLSPSYSMNVSSSFWKEEMRRRWSSSLFLLFPSIRVFLLLLTFSFFSFSLLFSSSSSFLVPTLFIIIPTLMSMISWSSSKLFAILPFLTSFSSLFFFIPSFLLS